MSPAIPLSVLDLAPITEGGSAAESFAHTVDLARHAESWGYRRYWMAEHHGMTGIASAATAVLIGHVAGATSRIRVGAGGIMLPNHSPLVIAEQFGTLAALYPGRVDLGLGRAPGTDMRTAQALRRNLEAAASSFPNDILELRQLMGPMSDSQPIIAIPGANSNVPIWLLGSSMYSAHLAAMLGLPYAFASHFAPDLLMEAITLYRDRFTPSEELDRPYVMAGVMGAAAATDEEAAYHFTSAQQQFVNLRRNVRGQFPRPLKSMDGFWSEMEKINVEHTLRYAVVGSKETAVEKLGNFIRETQADEIIISMPIHDIEARLRSVDIFADVRETLAAQA